MKKRKMGFKKITLERKMLLSELIEKKKRSFIEAEGKNEGSQVNGLELSVLGCLIQWLRLYAMTGS